MSDENLKEVEKLNFRPFTRFCMSIGAVPSSYLAGLDIEEQLLWLCSYLEKEVIPAVNNNAEAVEELQNLYVQLHDYVEHYFDNLDVQEEINNKLDSMVEDGTLQTLIDNYAQPILSDLTESINATKDQVDDATEDLNTLMESIKTPMDLLREEYYNDYSYFNLPNGLNEFFDILKVYRSNDKQNFKVNLTNEDLKASTTVVKYVDNVNGSNSNDGSTEALAYKTLTYGLGQMAADTTFILLNDKYYRNEVPDTGRAINYNVNIIPKKRTLYYGNI